jgi:hypothetical protein
MKIPALVLSIGMFTACGMPMPSDPDLNCTGVGTATLAANVQPVIDAKCKGCHDATNATYGDYSNAAKTGENVGKKSLYAGMPGTLKVVEASNLANSSLWLKLLGGQARGRSGPKAENVLGAMPNAGFFFTLRFGLRRMSGVAAGSSTNSHISHSRL